MVRFWMLVSIFFLLLGSLGCQSEPERLGWQSQTLYALETKIQTVAYGRLWEGEIPCLALAAADGRCVVLWYETEEWKHRELHQAPGGLNAIAIGDADATTPGPDLVVGTGTGQVLRIYVPQEGDVLVKLIFQAESPIGDIAVFDLDPNSDGSEILVVTESGRATVLYQPEEAVTGAYRPRVVLQDTARLRNIVVGKFGPQSQEAAIFVGASGLVSRIYAAGDNWRTGELYKNPEPLARIAVGNVDPDSETIELVLVDDVGLITLLRQRSGQFVPQAVHKEERSLRGVAVGEFQADIPGEEFAVFGYGKEVALFTRRGSEFDRRVLFQDSDRGHWLIANQIYSDTAEYELVAVGYSGKVTLIFMK